METKKSCGCIVLLGDKFLLIQDAVGKHWDFPKGGVEKGELEEDTALREVREETGLKVTILDSFREGISYIDHMNNVKKEVIFFLAKSESKIVKPQEGEILNYVWLNFDEALKKLTHQNARDILIKAQNFLNKQNNPTPSP